MREHDRLPSSSRSAARCFTLCRSQYLSLSYGLSLSFSLSANQLDEASAEPLASRFDRRSVDRSLSNASLLSEFNLARAPNLFSKKKSKNTIINTKKKYYKYTRHKYVQ